VDEKKTNEGTEGGQIKVLPGATADRQPGEKREEQREEGQEDGGKKVGGEGRDGSGRVQEWDEGRERKGGEGKEPRKRTAGGRAGYG
jgi:hypothetical protein